MLARGNKIGLVMTVALKKFTKPPVKRSKGNNNNTMGGYTQDCIMDLKEDISKLYDQIANGGQTKSGGKPTMTQVEIGELSEEIDGLKSRLHCKPSLPKQSKNSL